MESSLTQDPDVVIYPEHRPLLVPTINHFGGREGDPYMEQSGNTYGWETELGKDPGLHVPARLLPPTCTAHDPTPCPQKDLPHLVPLHEL